jgi:hypothetical protein
VFNLVSLAARRRRRPGQKGQALAEFALVAPIFFLLVFSVIQFGIIFGAQNNLVNSARDAARKAATYRVNQASFDATSWAAICDSIEQTLRDDVSDYPGMDGDGTLLDPDIAYEWEQQANGDWFLVAHVSATYAHPLYVPLVSFFIDGTDGTVDERLTLSASEQMRVENPALENTGGSPPPC